MVDFVKTCLSFVPLTLILVNTYIKQNFIHSTYYKTILPQSHLQKPPRQYPQIMFK